MKRQRLLLTLSAVLSVTLWAYACGDGTTEPPPEAPRPTTVTVSPSTAELAALGATVQLSAQVLDQNGQVMAGATVNWSSSDAAVTSVDAAGLVTAVANGSATITATSGSASGSAMVTVVNPDRAALVTLYNATDGPNWLDNTNWLTDAPLGAWYGVHTDRKGRVVQIRLNGRWEAGREISHGLRGEIPPELDGLANLTLLDLSNNALTGPIPSELGNLANLTDLWLSFNALTGAIPSELGNLANLTALQLSNNALTGPIPPELGNLANLTWLPLSGNALTGPIPPELGRLANLTRLYISRNELTGPIPPELGRLANLIDLHLGSNALTGPIPPELGDLANLRQLHLELNELTGAIPPELGRLANLTRLDLWNNELTGPIPPELGRLANLTTGLFLNGNALTGPIPPELGDLSNLKDLFLYGNALSGPIPPELGDLQKTVRLVLGDNDLSGPIPPELGSLETLEYLGLGGNDLGAFPQTFLNLRNLTGASSLCNPGGVCVPGTSAFVGWKQGLEDGNLLAFCNASDQMALTSFYELADGGEWAESGGWLGGPVLEEWYGVETDSLGRVTALALSDNGLSGSLPGAIAELGHLASLRIDGNVLSGRLPLGLTALDLEEFHYDGTDLCEPANAEFRDWLDGIPSHRGTAVQCAPLTDRDALVALYTSTGGPGWTNNSGWLTEAPLRRWHGVEVDARGRVVRLDLARNELSGPIPLELRSLSNLESLSLAHNGLSGAIPPELGSLSNLVRLDFWGNELVGPIPPELGNLSNLGRLSLALNGLSGAIPPELGSLSNLVELDFNYNELVGPIPPELGNLSNLWSLSLAQNGLSGAIPPELGDLSNLRYLSLSNTGLSGAIPPELGSLANLTDLDLDNNALTGAIPPELGGLANLERMSLAQNGLSGAIPPTFGELASMIQLELSHNPGLAGAMPAGLRNLALESLMTVGTALCVPREPALEEWLETIPRRWIALCGEPQAAYLVQAVQSRAHPVPLVAGEDALLRVFVTAAMETTEGIPAARARFYLNGTERHVADIPGSSTPIPTEIDEGDLAASANAEIPGRIVQPGLEMVVEIDPDGVLDASLGVPRRIPQEGRLAVSVEAMPLFDLTLIPFIWTQTHDSSIVNLVEAMAADPENHEMFGDTRTLLPVKDLKVTAHESVLSSSNDNYTLLGQTDAIRVMEGGAGYYKGMMSGAVGGIAFIGGWSSVSSPSPRIIAHELGHNMSLAHAPSCGAGNPDPLFPYPNGAIGAWGYDFRRDRLVAATRKDHMSYCKAAWASDYHFTSALNHRLDNEGASTAAHAAAKVRSLLLWGGVDTTGTPFLNPAFVADAPPALPESAGDYTVTGRDAGGRDLFSLSFAMPVALSEEAEVASFVFALPVQPAWADALASVTLSGPAGTVTLDGDSDIPTAILRDPRTGEVRAILRDPPAATEVAADGAGVDQGLDVLFSRGIPGAAAWRR